MTTEKKKYSRTTIIKSSQLVRVLDRLREHYQAEDLTAAGYTADPLGLSRRVNSCKISDWRLASAITADHMVITTFRSSPLKLTILYLDAMKQASVRIPREGFYIATRRPPPN